MGIVVSTETLHLFLLGIDDTKCALITTTKQITHDGTTWFVNVVGTTDNDNTFGLQKLLVNHNCFVRFGYADAKIIQICDSTNNLPLFFFAENEKYSTFAARETTKTIKTTKKRLK